GWQANAWWATDLRWTRGGHPCLRVRRRPRPRAAGVLRVVGGRPHRGGRLPAGAGTARADPSAVPGDAGPVAARAAVGQGAVRPAAAGPRDPVPAAEAAGGGRPAAPGA